MTFNFSGSLSSAYLVFSVLCILSFPHLLPSTHKRIHVVFSFTHPIHCFLRSLPSSPFSSFLSLNWNHPQTTTNLYLFFFFPQSDLAKTPTFLSCNLFGNKTESLLFWVESSLDLTHDPNMGFLGWGEMGRDKVGSRWNGFSGLRQSGFSGFPLNLVCVLFILGWFFFFLVDFSLIFFWFLG